MKQRISLSRFPNFYAQTILVILSLSFLLITMAPTCAKLGDAQSVTNVDVATGSTEHAELGRGSEMQERVIHIRRKVDYRLCLIIAVLYTVCQIDRQNLAYAFVNLPP